MKKKSISFKRLFDLYHKIEDAKIGYNWHELSSQNILLHQLIEESETEGTNWYIVKTFFFKKIEALF